MHTFFSGRRSLGTARGRYQNYVQESLERAGRENVDWIHLAQGRLN
jgi:hypothetical protein